MYVYACVYSAHRCQKKVLDNLEVEMLTVTNHHVSAKTGIAMLTFHTSTWEVEMKRSLGIQGKPGLQSQFQAILAYPN